MIVLWLLLAFAAGLLVGALALPGAAGAIARRRAEGPWRKLLGTAFSRVVAGEHGEAARLLRSAVELAPGDDGLVLLLGEELRRAGDLARAARVPDLLLARRELQPDIRAAALLLRGRILEAEGRWREALDAYGEALLALPRSEEILVATERLLSRLRRWDEAIEVSRRLVRVNPERGRIVLARRHVLEARERLAEGNAEEALAAAREAARNWPDMGAGELTRGDALYQLGRHRRAREAWLEAARVQPRLAPLVLDRLEHLEGGEGRAAVRGFAEQALGELGEEPRARGRILAWLADDALRRGDAEAARGWLERLRRDHPGVQATARLEARLAAAGTAPPPSLARLLERWAADPPWPDPWRCTRCGAESPEFRWRCRSCLGWETLS